MMKNNNPNLNLKKQQKYSIKVVKKFFALYDCGTLDEFSKQKNYAEESHAFSYIVNASALLNSDDFITDIIINRNMDNLERIVYNSLFLNNEWYEKSKNKGGLNKDQMKFYLKLSI